MAGLGAQAGGQAGAHAGLDAPAVTRWLAGQGLADPPVEYAVITGGHSNFTYEVRDAAGRRLVLRRPPLATLGGRGNDVLREHRVISALADTPVPVPRTLAACTDHTVTGADFYVMEFVEGRVLAEPADVAGFLPDPTARRRAGESLVDALAALHGVDVAAVGLADLARREGYVRRQLARMSDMWQRTKTREVPLFDELTERLLRTVPAEHAVGLVHGDFRLGNAVVGADGTVAAVLDWELCTLGDGRADLGYLLNSWELPGDGWPPVWMVTPATAVGGFIDRAAVVERYVAATGREVTPTEVDWFRAFSYWRSAVISEGVKRRYESGLMGDRDVDATLLSARVLSQTELADAHLRAALGS